MSGNLFIYQFLTLIPKGKVISYKSLGEVFCMHPRAVAKAMSSNQNQDKYPCYKVVNNDGTLGGYNLGIVEKIRKLKDDGVKLNVVGGDKAGNSELNLDNSEYSNEMVNGNLHKKKGISGHVEGFDKNNFSIDNYMSGLDLFTDSNIISVDKSCFWIPKLTNFFVALPLMGDNLNMFTELINRLSLNPQLKNYKINYQKISSAHITLKFFGNISLVDFADIVAKCKSFKYSFPELLFNDTGNFGDSIVYLKPDLNTQTNLIKFKDRFIQAVDIEEKEIFNPHITVCKIGKNSGISGANLSEIVKIVNDEKQYVFNDNLLRFYCAVDGNHQIPLFDIKLI